MKKTRFTDEQIAFALRQAEKPAHRCRKSSARWGYPNRPFTAGRSCTAVWAPVKYAGPGSWTMKNRRLKQMVADLSLDKHILQDVLSRKL